MLSHFLVRQKWSLPGRSRLGRRSCRPTRRDRFHVTVVSPAWRHDRKICEVRTTAPKQWIWCIALLTAVPLFAKRSIVLTNGIVGTASLSNAAPFRTGDLDNRSFSFQFRVHD